MVTALPQLWRHALRSASNGARVRLRSSSTPNVHRGERRYHVKNSCSTNSISSEQWIDPKCSEKQDTLYHQFADPWEWNGENASSCYTEGEKLQLYPTVLGHSTTVVRLRLKCDGTRAETRFRLSAKRTSLFKSAGASVQSTTGSRGVRISGSNAGYTMFRGSVKSTGYPLHSPVSPSLLLPCVTVCHHISSLP